MFDIEICNKYAHVNVIYDQLSRVWMKYIVMSLTLQTRINGGKEDAPQAFLMVYEWHLKKLSLELEFSL